MAVNFDVYEQEMFGKTHWRVMRRDGRLVFDGHSGPGNHQVDFPSRQEAFDAILGDVRRNKRTSVRISEHWINRARDLEWDVAVDATFKTRLVPVE